MHLHFAHDRDGRQLFVQEGYSSGRIHLTACGRALALARFRFSADGWEQWRRGLAAALAGGPSSWQVRNEDDFQANWEPDALIESVYDDREVRLVADQQWLVLKRAEAVALLSYADVAPIVPALASPSECTPLAERLAAPR